MLIIKHAIIQLYRCTVLNPHMRRAWIYFFSTALTIFDNTLNTAGKMHLDLGYDCAHLRSSLFDVYNSNLTGF